MIELPEDYKPSLAYRIGFLLSTIILMILTVIGASIVISFANDIGTFFRDAVKSLF